MHERLASALRQAIRQGQLSPGAALPPSRQLAADLGCSRWVVTEAYAQLVAEGYLQAKTGSATRVSADWPEVTTTVGLSTTPSEPRYDLLPGMPDLRAFPRSRWAEAVRAAATTMAHQDLWYTTDGGLPQTRLALAEYLARNRGVVTSTTDVRITTGVADGLTQVFRTLHRKGFRSVAVEDPAWQRPAKAARDSGLEVVPIPVDESGIRLDHLTRRDDCRAVLVTPAHQFPMGMVLASKRRAALLDWLRRVDGVLLEDDYDAEFRYDRPPVGAVQAMDPARVFLFGSVSKTLAPAVGVGWMVHPPGWSDEIREANPVVTSPSALAQTAFAHMLTSGAFDRHLRDSRRRLRRRRDKLVRALRMHLPEHRVSGIAAGLHLVLHLPVEAGIDVPSFIAEVRSAGVRLCSIDIFRNPPDPRQPALVLGYGNLADSVVEEAVTQLATYLEKAIGTLGQK
ncbi:MAG TPA: GntR family transcriptional regulator [Micromonosporaceae bacterium]|nr:GntR family transcriptional regulator [Micromonosporaceae bacterium]